MQIKNCWEELQPKTVGALRDDKLFGYVLKRPVYPIGLIVTQLGNLSKNGLLFDSCYNLMSHNLEVHLKFYLFLIKKISSIPVHSTDKILHTLL